MTYEEARNMIDEMRAEIKAKHMCRSMDGKCTSEEVAEYRCRFAALSMAANILNKQIPQKVVLETDHTWGIANKQPICPACDNGLTRVLFISDAADGLKRVTYCEHCGQALDWSE